MDEKSLKELVVEGISEALSKLDVGSKRGNLAININIIDGVEIAYAKSGYNTQAVTGNKDGKLICGHVDRQSSRYSRLLEKDIK